MTSPDTNDLVFRFFDVPPFDPTQPGRPASSRPPRSPYRSSFVGETLATDRRRGLPSTTDLSALAPRRKTLLVLDWNNLVCSAQALGRRFDEAALLEQVRSAKLARLAATAVISAEESRLTAHVRRLKAAGYDVVSEPAHRVANKVKANMDPALAGVVTKAVLRERVTQIVLGSGDGDFVGLIKFLRPFGARALRVVAMGVEGSIARSLRETADATVELGTDVLVDRHAAPPPSTAHAPAARS